MILAQNWPKTAKSSWHCPFKVAEHSFSAANLARAQGFQNHKHAVNRAII